MSRRTMCRVLALLYVTMAGLPGAAPAAARASQRVEVPIYQVVVHGRGGDGIRYFVALKVGDEPAMRAMLDTGSTGLWVLSTGIQDPQSLPDGSEARDSYAAGDVLLGRQTRARLTIGPAETPRPVEFGLVTAAQCQPQVPDCEASKTDFEHYLIGSEGYSGQGFQAVLGISLGSGGGPNPLPNPLATIAEQWIVELPLQGAQQPGRLILNPDENDLNGFQLFNVTAEAPHWGGGARRGSIAGCVVPSRGGERFCGGLSLDSGASSVLVETTDRNLFGRLSAGGPYAFEFGNGDQKLSWRMDIPPKGFVQTNDSQGHASLTVILPFLAYWSLLVLYDPADDQVGLKQR